MTRHRHGRITVETSREDKVFFPGAGLTKGDLIGYYERVADRLLPHLAGRPLVLQRFPDGIAGQGFYQKEAGAHFPGWLSTVRVPVGTGAGTQRLVVCDNATALVYLANQACVTLHPWLSRQDRLDDPDQLVIDLDPGDGAFATVRDAARRVRDLLDGLGLVPYLKLTGSAGLHIVVPISRGPGFDEVRAFARDVAALLASRHPDSLTTEQRKQKRNGRLYLDTGRNAYGQTAVAPWSVRALPEAPIAAPLAWSDLGRVGPRDYTVGNVFRRIARRDDPWAGMRRHARSLARARRRLDRVR